MRYFNTAGPCQPDRHYMIPAAARLPPLVRRHIERALYFVVHAPRQTGKTTTLAAIAQALRTEGQYAALHLSCETASVTGDDYAAAERLILGAISAAANEAELEPEVLPPRQWPGTEPGQQLMAALRAWAEQSPKPLVLFLDEIDSLAGPSLITVLRQLRDGYNSRPAPFPQSVVLCGMRDVKDYKRYSGGDPSRLSSPSPFNIMADSLRLGDFTAEEVGELYAQHTADTGQRFTPEAAAKAYEYTRGQPWLVNALAAEIVDKMCLEPSTPIDAGHVERARERLILARATHLDSLADKLNEPRVAKVIEPIIAGELGEADATFDDDVTYLQDLGLLAQGTFIQIANPIYHEVIIRVLGTKVERRIRTDPHSFVLADGRLDFRRLLEEFSEFWSQNADVLIKGGTYHEVAPQLVLMAYVNRIVNGGGFIDREFGLGHGRIDLLIRWPYEDPDGKRAWQREPIELKVWHPTSSTDPMPEGLVQLDGYLDRLQIDHGTLIVFDRRPANDKLPPLAQRIAFSNTTTPSGRPVTLLRA